MRAGREVPAHWTSGGLLALLALALLPVGGHTGDDPARPPELAPEPMTVETLGTPGPHWVWANDGVVPAARLFDADTGRMLGMLTTTAVTNSVAWDLGRREVVFPGSYYARTNHGPRTDVVNIYSLDTLQPLAEVVLPEGPPKIANGYPIQHYNTLLDGNRWLAIYNFNPTMSVTLVDVVARRHAGELMTAGCGLVFAAGPASFLQLCGDGTVQRVDIDDAGRETARQRTAKFFDAAANPLLDKGARAADRWWFATFDGELFGVAADLDVVGPWPLQARPDDAGWRPGGRMPLAVHRARNRLYVLMHEGGPDTHKAAGTEVWVYDIASRERLRRVQLRAPAPSIQVTQDDAPLLIAVNRAERALDVYAADDGRHLRTIAESGIGVTLIETVDAP